MKSSNYWSVDVMQIELDGTRRVTLVQTQFAERNRILSPDGAAATGAVHYASDDLESSS